MPDARTDDSTIFEHIQALVAEEQQLRESPTLLSGDRQRLQQVRVELDQCWDLLRQRRAKREFGDDPDSASVRPAETVERYVG
jgi:ABC-type hemin transport system ATPase subunit